MKPRLLAILAVLALTGCEDIKYTPEGIQSQDRLVIVENHNFSAIMQDRKTGCEFIAIYGGGRSITAIPGTCRAECPGQ